MSKPSVLANLYVLMGLTVVAYGSYLYSPKAAADDSRTCDDPDIRGTIEGFNTNGDSIGQLTSPNETFVMPDGIARFDVICQNPDSNLDRIVYYPANHDLGLRLDDEEGGDAALPYIGNQSEGADPGIIVALPGNSADQ